MTKAAKRTSKGSSGNGSDREVFLGHIVEIMDGTLPPRFREIAERHHKNEPGLLERFTEVRGALQNSLHSVFCSEQELLELRRFVRNEEERHRLDEERIEEVAARERSSFFLRNITFLFLTVVLGYALFYYFTPPAKPTFDALQALAYEAMAYEDSDESRLDFPTDSIADVALYFRNNPQLEIKPLVFGALPKPWKLDGVGVIDYDTAKVAVVQYGNSELDEKVFHFSYSGKMSDLTKSEQGEVDGFEYQTYASDRVNIVAWAEAENMVGMMIGHRGAEELAALVKAGLAKK